MLDDVRAGALAAGAVMLLARAVGAQRRERWLARMGSPEAMPLPGSSPRSSVGAPVWPFCLSTAIVGLVVGWVVAGSPGAAIGGCAGGASPVVFRRRRAARRLEMVGDQLADAVSAIAAGGRSGLSLTQSVSFAAGQVGEPLGSSLREVADRTALGSPLEDALDRWVTAIPVPDVRLAAAVLRLHRRTGGALPPVLDGLARTLRERRASVREVHSLTAQARLSGAILGLLPLGFFLFLSATSRRDMAAAFRAPAGLTAIVVGLVLQAVAFLWIRHLLRVER
jgi:tight adherence protein B